MRFEALFHRYIMQRKLVYDTGYFKVFRFKWVHKIVMLILHSYYLPIVEFVRAIDTYSCPSLKQQARRAGGSLCLEGMLIESVCHTVKRSIVRLFILHQSTKQRSVKV